MRISTLIENNSEPLIFDGAFGTYYRSLYHSDHPCELANLTQPEQVREIHAAYLAAGAQVLLTNTFAANFSLTEDKAHLQEILAAGLRLAKQAAGEKAAVLADIGPLPSRESEEELAAQYVELVDLFLAAGAEDFIFETMPEFSLLQPALARLTEKRPDAFILVSFAVSQDGYSRNGFYYKDLLNAAFSTPSIAGSGLNCVCGPSHIYRLLADYPRAGKKLIAMPNAGYPTQVNQRIVYEDNEAYYAERLAEIANLGCAFVGGCCGTTPRHIQLATERIREHTPARPAALVAKPGAPTAAQARQGGDFLAQLAAARKALVVELNPPIAADVEPFMAAAHHARAAGADILSITDSPLARVRADSMILAAKLRREVGCEVLPHLSCRDRNRLGIQAALLGAAIEDVRYVLAVRGDAVDEGVFKLTSRQLIAFIASLNRELLANHPYGIGGALNINAANFTAELKRARAKEEAGCQFFLTQPVYAEPALENLALASQTLAAPVVAGILPPAGYKNATFLNNEVGGIHIPTELIEQLRLAEGAEARTISLTFCKQLLRQAAPYAAGYYFMTPLNRIEWVCELVEDAQTL